MKLKAVAVFTILFGVVIVFEVLLKFIVFKNNTEHSRIRQFILDKKAAGYYKAQPYLNYINNPRSTGEAGLHEINEWGLRGMQGVGINKPDSVLRVLFLGGSTTYGEVSKAEDAFPALVQKEFKKKLPAKYKGIECLNAGMGAATSAELLTHYIFKYKYLNSDIVVIHTGINDAFSNAVMPGYVYQPDYHTSRKIVADPYIPGKVVRFLCNSNIFCFFVIHIKYTERLNSSLQHNEFFDYNSEGIWFTPGNDSMYVNRFNAFNNNIRTLVNAIRADGKKVLLLTEVIEPRKMPKEFHRALSQGIAYNRLCLIKIAGDLAVPVCILNKADYPASLFWENDGIHLNEEGERKKAAGLKPYIDTLIAE